MNSPASSTSLNTESPLSSQLLAHFLATQNTDGGWPFHASGALSPGDSRVEPTCWSLLALANNPESAQPNITRGLEFLRAQQLSDGSWPASSGMSSGGWVTSLAALTLAQFPANEKSFIPALQWLCDDYPRDSSRWQKFLKSFSSAKHESHNNEFRGWGWTPRTSSWVEPTSFALLAFSSALSSGAAPFGSKGADFSSGPAIPPSNPHFSAELAKQIAQRRDLAVGLLYDRICAGGGWNCGNPRVYGVDGESLVLPTCWALLALRNAPDHPNRALSLQWLQKSLPTIASPGSLAVAQITLENYNVRIPSATRQLTDFSAADLAEQGTHVAVWSALALNRSRCWPTTLAVSP
jgi:hypothetical protein